MEEAARAWCFPPQLTLTCPRVRTTNEEEMTM